eukprot:scaffold417_cov388-Prasinococcus_capsulatus_cf.AAC.3
MLVLAALQHLPNVLSGIVKISDAHHSLQDCICLAVASGVIDNSRAIQQIQSPRQRDILPHFGLPR